MRNRLWTLGLLLVLVAVLAACGASRQEKLLAENWRAMNDEALLEYYYRLDEEIQRCVSGSPETSVGVGGGTVGGGGLFGVGVSRQVGGGCDPENLRRRKVDVRMELKSREISP